MSSSTLVPRGLHAQSGARHGEPDAYGIPKPDAEGPYKPTWASIRDLHRTPAWFNQAKFGIFIHWGLYSIPARINEWYERHMYTTDVAWHTQHYGSPDKFGYKDFIPLFTARNYNPDAWATLFKSAGAKYVVPVAEHRDGFSPSADRSRAVGPLRKLLHLITSISLRGERGVIGMDQDHRRRVAD